MSNDILQLQTELLTIVRKFVDRKATYTDLAAVARKYEKALVERAGACVEAENRG
jgi:hypothetical protein